MACCCNQQGACCESNGTCSLKPQSQCQGAGQTFAGIGTQCNICRVGGFFRTCTVTVTSAFGSVVCSCVNPSPAVLQAECGKVRNASGNVVSTTCNQLSAGLITATCPSRSTAGNVTGCEYRDRDGNLISFPSVAQYEYNLAVVVSRRDMGGGCGSGDAEAVGTFHLITVNEAVGQVTVTQKQQNDQTALVDGASCGKPNPGVPGAWLDLRWKKCFPCGLKALVGSFIPYSCGIRYYTIPDASVGDLSTIDCCTLPLTHTVSVACAP